MISRKRIMSLLNSIQIPHNKPIAAPSVSANTRDG